MYKNKRMWLVIGMIIATLVLSACGGGATPAPEEAAPTAEKPAPAKPAAPAAKEGGCPASTVANPKGLEGKYPQQFELAEYEAKAGCTMTFSENPNIAPIHGESSLPPVEERLPEEPLVVQPYNEIGKYGGTMRGVSFAPEHGTSGILSWRHVNLVRFSDDLFTVVPNVAKGWEWNDDYTELTFFLRRGHKWSDGEPFTADDVLFWYYDLVRNKELRPELDPTWVFGGEPMEIEKIDDYTVKFKFAVPAPGMLIFWAHTYIQPFQPKHYLSQFHIDYNPDANSLAKEKGYGSWTELMACHYHDWKDTYHCVGVPTLESHVLVEETSEIRRYRANPYYFKVDTTGQQLPYIDEHYEEFIPDKEVINLKIVNGEVDHKMQATELVDYPLYKENEGPIKVQLANAGMASMVYVTFNQTHKDPEMAKIFSDRRFREAMSLAINRKEIAESVYYGQATPMQAVPGDPSSVPYVSEEAQNYLTEYDPDHANALLDEMGLTERGSDGFRLRFDGKPLVILFEYPVQAGPPLVHELLADYWKAVGVNVELKEVSSEVYRSRSAANNHDIATWHYDGTSFPSMASLNPLSFTPPFGDFLNTRTGTTWREWYVACMESGQDVMSCKTDAGEEPPDSVKPVWGIVDHMRQLLPGSDEWIEAGKELVQNHVFDNFYHIGTVGNIQGVVVTSARMRNVPKFNSRIYDYYWNYPYRVDQWYIEEQ